MLIYFSDNLLSLSKDDNSAKLNTSCKSIARIIGGALGSISLLAKISYNC